MPDDHDHEPRPGAVYLETMMAALPWAARPVTVWDATGAVEEFRGSGVHLIAEVLEKLATYGLLVGEEHHHELTDDEARNYAQWLHSRLPDDSAAARKYGPTGLGPEGILTYAGLEFCYPIAYRAAAGEPDTLRRLRAGYRGVTLWLKEREGRS